jgi:pimeloyl-ACP methyl ester carboxylesterase
MHSDLSANRIPLVFLPGLLCDERLWHAQATALADIAVPMTANLTLDDSIAGMARRVLGEAPPRFALAGLSMGGYVAFEILRQAPSRVTRLALFDTTAAPDTPERRTQRLASVRAARFGRFAGVTPRLLSQLVHESRVSGPVGIEVRAMAQRVGRDAFLRQQNAILGRPDSVADLVRITVPTVIGVGDSDVLTPLADAHLMHRAILGSTLHVFAKCGHLPALETPDEASQVLRAWLLG